MRFAGDIILFVILALAILRGCRKGFAFMTVSLVGTVLAVAISIAASGPAAQLVYKACFENKISQSVDAALGKHASGSADQAIDELFADDSVVAKVAGTCGITAEDVKKNLPSGTLAGAGRSITNDIIRPALVSFMRVIAIIVLAIVLLFVVAILSRMIGRTFKATPLRGVNRFFGGVMGFITGAAVVVFACSLLNTMLNIMPDGFLGITEASRDNSIIYRFVTQTLNIYIG